MMLYFGRKVKKLLVYSHASDTKMEEAPTRRFPPIDGRIPPTEIVGSALAAIRISLIIEVVVVLPCVPATAMDFS